MDSAFQMTQRSRVLVVMIDERERDMVVQWLVAAGCEPTVTGDFQLAKQELDTRPPDLLIASVKLGPYNGLHLAIRGRLGGSGTPAILIGDTDPVLRAEAEQHRTTYIARPLDRTHFLATVHELLTLYRPARRSPRKRVPRVDALIDGTQAAVVELSYEGLRLELAETPTASVPPYFTVQVPTFNISCRVQRIWVSRPPELNDVLWCGAAIATNDASAAVAWRHFVDNIPGWTVAMN
jgi:CheY-like chemotaxis protein